LFQVYFNNFSQNPIKVGPTYVRTSTKMLKVLVIKAPSSNSTFHSGARYYLVIIGHVKRSKLYVFSYLRIYLDTSYPASSINSSVQMNRGQ
jgi:hypothetical protein